MLIIRQEQMDALRDALQRGFDAEMVAHLRQYFPAETAAQDDAQLFELIGEGKQHARAYGAESTDALLRFIDVRLVLGPTFDTNPALAWVAQPLRDPFLPTGDARIEEMALRAVDWIAGRRPESSGR